MHGGGWKKERHDFLSLPLLARENTVIPLGAVDSRPDYDYTDGIELQVFEPKNGELRITVPDVRGGQAAEYILKIENGRADCFTDALKPYTVIVHRNGREG